MRALIRKIATWLLFAVVGGIIISVAGEWVIEVVRAKGGFNDADKTFDWGVSVIRQFVTSWWVLGPVIYLAGLVSGLWIDALLSRVKSTLKKNRKAPPVPLKVAEPAKPSIPNPYMPQPLGPVRQPPDPKKADFIADLFPLLQEFSERHVDEFGNKTADWRESFIHGLSREWIDNAYAELRALSARFSEVRSAFESHKFYTDIYVMDDAIAQRLGAIGTALQPARNVAESLSYTFDKRSIELVEDHMDKFRRSIGGLRTYVSQECLSSLTKMRAAALG